MISEDRCVLCGSLDDSEAKSISETPLWICSIECWIKAATKLMPKEFQNTNDGEDTPAVREARLFHANALENNLDAFMAFKSKSPEDYETWTHEQPSYQPYLEAKEEYLRLFQIAVDEANEELTTHYQLEWVNLYKQRQLKREQGEAKEAEKLRKEEEKLSAKRALEQTKEDERAAEEERWRPKPFKL